MNAFQNAFITGASSGIGRAIAEALAARGVRVIAAARRESELADLCGRIRDRGGRADPYVLDVTDLDRVRETVLRWDRVTGGLDLVLANAGVGRSVPVARLGWPEAENTVRVNLLGALATLSAAIPPMLARRRGTLAAVSSLAGVRGLPTSAVYSASKAGISAYLEALGTELRPHGIAVVDIRPGFVDTPMSRRNRLWMPFLMDAQAAAARAVRGLERGQAVVAFPFALAAAMSLARFIPAALWRRVAGRLPVNLEHP